MKSPKKKTIPATKAALKKAASAAGFKTVKITKVTPSNKVEVSPSYAARALRAKERRKARLVTIPKEYKRAVMKYGIARTEKIERKRGRYYTAAGVYNIQRFDLAVKKSPAKTTREVSPYEWNNSSRKGWYIVTIGGEVQKKMKRWKAVNREQKKAWREDKISRLSEKTGITKTAARAIVSQIRREETVKVKRYKKTKGYKKLKAWEKKKVTIANRVTAIFGALCDLLEIYGSPDTKPDKE